MNQDLYLEHNSSEKNLPTVSVSMLSTKNTENAEESNRIVENTEGLIQEAIEADSIFYRITLTEIPPAFIGDRNNVNQMMRRKTEQWEVGGNTKNGLVLLDPRLYKNTAEQHGLQAQTEHIFSEEYYSKLLKHEIGHAYFQTLLGTPNHGGEVFIRWLNEGCQQVAAGQMSKDNVKYEYFNGAILHQTLGIDGFYPYSAKVVLRLIEIYGQEEFVDKLHVLLSRTGQEFIKGETEESADPEKVFKDSFAELFGFELTKENMEKFVKTGHITSESVN